ncbi:MAG: YybH family protein [Candidatus Limnocylindrales bacterium]
MAANLAPAPRTAELFRLLDAKDEAGLRALWADDAQAADEITRGWIRDHTALDGYFRDNLPRLTDIHSVIHDVAVRAFGDVAIETCLLRQSYIFDGTKVEIEAPTTTIWRRQADGWKLALMHSVPLAPAS